MSKFNLTVILGLALALASGMLGSAGAAYMPPTGENAGGSVSERAIQYSAPQSFDRTRKAVAYASFASASLPPVVQVGKDFSIGSQR